MQPKILIVDDEQAIREMVAFALTRAGMQCREAIDANDAHTAIVAARPDLVLLDWMLPGMSGVDFARRLRRDELTSDMPIIMLTARGSEDERVRGLDSGADDYLSKPFSTRELIARIRAVLRRTSPIGPDEFLERDRLKLDLAARRAYAAGTEFRLGPIEFRLLGFLMSHPERVYSRSQLLDRVWGGDVYVDERTVDVHIRRVRKALEPFQCNGYIQTVRGSGYRFSTAD